ncbi:MAG: hypothetical protein M1818_006416 [Claussenomyces sp. TS43310]|nr:MAG: hypothetical protein M1818_006416 [Claussenomyces sp. TS43310]
MAGLSPQAQRELEIFQRQYLQLQADLIFPGSNCLRQEAFQQVLYEEVFKDDAVVYQPPLRYQLRVLKELLSRIESSITDWDEDGISDGLMSRLSVLLSSAVPPEAVAAQQKTYVTYTLSSLPPRSSQISRVQHPIITLLESRNLIAAAGTTGLRTWEASLHLGSFLCSSRCPVNIAGKTVLELGAGTGFLSILCARYLDAVHVTATDGSDTVVSELPTNFYLNNLQDASQIYATELIWGHALMGGETAEWNLGRKIDVVLGADVTYDSSVIPSLVATVVDLINLFPEVKVILGATIRKESSFQYFLRVCAANSLAVEDIPFEVPKADLQTGPFYANKFPIKLCSLAKPKIGQTVI